METQTPYLVGVAERASFRLDSGLVAKMRRVADDRGLSQKDAWSRLILWFVAQEEEVHALLLGVLPDKHHPAAVRTVLDSIKREFGPPAHDEET